MFASNLNVWEIDVNFCNQWNKLNLAMDAGTTTWICLTIKNLSQKEWMVSLLLVDWEMSQWEQPVQACKTSSEWLFGKAAQLLGEKTFPIKPWETVDKTWTITAPDGFGGNLYGCATITVSDITPDAVNGNEMFTIVTRKANTIVVSVSWEVRSSIELIGAMNIARNAEWSYSVSLIVKNNGTTAEQLIWSITISDELWLYNVVLPIANNTQIYPWEQKDFAFEVGKLPWHWGKFTFALTLDHTPVDETWKKVWPWGTVNYSEQIAFWVLQYGILPILWWAFILLVIFFFIERPFVKRRRAKRLAKKEAKKAAKHAKHHHEA